MLPENIINNSLIIINKPPKASSHEIAGLVKKMLGAKRSGHAGTLDPNVSGVLPVALGKATKLLQFIAAKDKTYIGIIKFKKIMDRKEIEKLFTRFTGEITQTPPKQSAVRKVPRKRTVYYLKFLEQSSENPRLVLFEAKVDAGTYIRTLCEDIGKLCGGARMEELRRTVAGRFDESIAVTMQDLADAIWLAKDKSDDSMLRKMLHNPEDFIDFPKVMIKNSAIKSIKQGAQIMFPAIKEADKEVKTDALVSIYTEDKEFFGIGKSLFDYSDYKSKKPERGMAVRIERVHM